MTDLLAIFQPDHLYMRQVLFRVARPAEIFLYQQLIRRLARRSEDLKSMNLLTDTTNLFESLLHNMSRATQHSRASTSSASSLSSQTPIIASLTQSSTISSVLSLNLQRQQEQDQEVSPSDRHICLLWMKSCHYLSIMSNKVTYAEFPPQESDKYVLDYLMKHASVAIDSFQSPTSSKYLKNGYLTELIHTLSSSASSVLSEDLNLTLSKKKEKSPCYDMSTNLTKLDEELQEQSISNILELLFHLRESIIPRRVLFLIPLPHLFQSKCLRSQVLSQ
jgi:hypothetical protein